MAVIPVPKYAFSLADVKTSIESHTSDTVNSLQTAFDKADSVRFNFSYDRDTFAPANSLKRFAGYGSACLIETYPFDDSGSTKKIPSYTRPYGLWMSLSGLYIYFICDYNKLVSFLLSPEWDITSMDSNYSASKQLKASKDYHGLFMSSTIQNIFTINTTDMILERWTSPYPNSIIDASYHSSFNLNITNGGAITAFTFSTDGTKLYLFSSHENVSGQVYKRSYVYQYNLTTAWSLSSYSLISKTMLGASEPTIIGAAFGSNGLRLYITATDGSTTQFELNTAPWTISGIENSKRSDFADNCYSWVNYATGGLYVREVDNGSRIIGADLYSVGISDGYAYHQKKRKKYFNSLL